MTEEQSCYRVHFKTATLVSTQQDFLSLQQQVNIPLLHTWDLINVRGGENLSPTAIC